MAHEITSTDNMVSVAITPWHRLGTVIPDGIHTSREIAEIAFRRRDGRGGPWDVQLHDVWTADGRPVPTVRAVVRDDTGDVIGDVGDGYRALSNADAFSIFDPLVERGLIRYETAGSLRGGARVWICARIMVPDAEIASGDTIATHVLLAHGHTRQAALAIAATGCVTRVVCANTLAAALGERLFRRIVHRGDVRSKTAAAIDTIDELRDAAAAHADRLRALVAAAAEPVDVAHYLSAVWQRPLAEIVGGRQADGTRAEPLARAVRVLDHFAAGDGAATIGTWWGVYQALTREITHGAAGSKKSPEQRAESNAWGAGAAQLARAEIVAEILARRSTAAAEIASVPTSRLATMIAA